MISRLIIPFRKEGNLENLLEISSLLLEVMHKSSHIPVWRKAQFSLVGSQKTTR